MATANITARKYPEVSKQLQSGLNDLDAMSQDCQAKINAMADAIKRLSPDESIQKLAEMVAFYSDDWGNQVNCLAEECGANYTGNQM
jgi:hypothetical protein